MDISLDGLKEIEIADSFWKRFRGWMGRVPEADEALLITPCSSIHTFFMRVPMDAVFLDSNGKVLRVIVEMKPWRCSPWIKGAQSVLELSAGMAKNLGIEEGKQLKL
ncbi:MAG: DUF192 domain-containing protein [Acidobacteriota bacterium]